MTFSRPQPDIRSRRTPRQHRSMMTVDSILEAAAILFARDGFEKTSTTRIAELAGVSVGSLYEYFSSKDSLLAYLVKRHCEQMLQHVAQQLQENRERSVAAVLRVFIDAIHDSYAQNFPLQCVLIEHLGRISQPYQFRRISNLLIGLLAEHLEECGESAPQVDIRQALYVIECVIESLIHRSILFDPQFFHCQLKEQLLSVSVGCLGLSCARYSE